MSNVSKQDAPGRMRSQSQSGGDLRVILEGRIDSHQIGRLWRQAEKLIRKKQPECLIVDASKMEYCDGTGAGLLLWMRNQQNARNGRFIIEGLRDEVTRLMEMLDTKQADRVKDRNHPARRVAENVGQATVGLWQDLCSQIVFVGELTSALFYVLLRPKKIRWRETLLVAEQTGANAFGIVALIGFLLGLILAYQSVYSLKDFGAEIYVADLVALGLLRELGPLITAIILAGRSGSAFAAELGTMKVNEEIDALATMGLEPVRFLAVSRVVAAVIVMPMLVLFAELFGLVGAGIVMLSRGFPLVTYITQVQQAVTITDFAGGMAKAIVFGILVAAIGCLRGLQTGPGARSVGISATRAVVSGLVLIVLADGVFAVIYNILEI